GSVAVTTELRTTSAEETEAAGERLAAALAPGAVVALVGELGAGKTCFIQGLVRGLGATTRATSPTFVMINEYRGRVPIYHVGATVSVGPTVRPPWDPGCSCSADRRPRPS